MRALQGSNRKIPVNFPDDRREESATGSRRSREVSNSPSRKGLTECRLQWLEGQGFSGWSLMSSKVFKWASFSLFYG